MSFSKYSRVVQGHTIGSVLEGYDCDCVYANLDEEEDQLQNPGNDEDPEMEGCMFSCGRHGFGCRGSKLYERIVLVSKDKKRNCF